MKNNANSLPVVLWGVAMGLALLSVHGGVPLAGGMQQYSLIDVPKPNSTADVVVAAVGGVIAFGQYFATKELGVRYTISMIVSYMLILGMIVSVNPTFTLLQRGSLVFGGVVGSVVSLTLIE